MNAIALELRINHILILLTRSKLIMKSYKLYKIKDWTQIHHDILQYIIYVNSAFNIKCTHVTSCFRFYFFVAEQNFRFF